MIPYWILLFIPLWACIRSPSSPWLVWESWIIGTFLTLFIGLRHEVGGDWFNYLPYLTRAEGLSLSNVMVWGDPGYNALNWLFASQSWGIYGVNLVSAVVSRLAWSFSAGISLALGWPFAFPFYLVIVVAMGYSRQGVAIG